MAFKTINRTIEEVERLAKLLDSELKKINLNTLSESEEERLQFALDHSYGFSCDLFEGDEDEDEGEAEDDG
jgi:hypothetical protein